METIKFLNAMTKGLKGKEEKTNIIKVRFNKDGKPQGREYSYLTPVEVQVGDIVEMETRGKVAKGTVTQTQVPAGEIVEFKDRIKTIIGKANLEEGQAENLEK